MMTDEFWIAFGDVHESLGNVHRIEGIAGASGVLVSGDLTNAGSRARARDLLDELAYLNPRIYAQIGNMDTGEVDSWLEEKGMNVHNRMVSLTSEVNLLGLGYSTPTPFSTPSEVEEKQMQAWLDNLIPQAKEAEHLIFMTHTPPYNTNADLLSSGIHAGSKAVRRFVEQVKPEVCITGHIHEARSADQLGPTRIINPGMLNAGGYVYIHFNGRQLTAELRSV